MFTRNTVHASILSVFASATLCLLSAAITAQKSPATDTVTASRKGLNAVNVKLARYGGMQFAGTSPTVFAKTDENGNFTFPVLPKGEYILTTSLPEDRKIRDSTKNNYDKLEFFYITLNLPEGKKVEMGYDLAQNKAFDPKIDPTKQSTSKTTRFVPFIFVSNGVDPCNGTIIKSKSNITNN